MGDAKAVTEIVEWVVSVVFLDSPLKSIPTQITIILTGTVIITVIITDVRRGTSGTSRDVPIFVQFHKEIRTVNVDDR